MKTLKKLIEGYGSKHDQGTRKPGEVGPDKVFKDNTPVSKKGNAPAPTEGSQEFVDDHEINRVKDANGNGDDVFKASNIKPTEREKGRHGYGAKKAEDVNEKRLTMKELKKREEVAQAIERDNPGMDMSKKMAIATSTAKKVAEATEEEYDTPQFDNILEAVHYHQQQEQDEAELIEAYSSVLESVYDGLEDEAAKQEFLQMLESDEAFDQLMDLVEERLGEE